MTVKPTKTEIALLRKEKVHKTYDVVAFNGGTEVTVRRKVDGVTKVKRFKSTKLKPAIRMAMEHVILCYPPYNPQTDRVTLIDAVDMGFG